MKNFFKNSRWIIIGTLVISLFFLNSIRTKPDPMYELLNRDTPFMSIHFLLGYDKNGSESTFQSSDIDWFKNYIETLNVKEIKKDNLYGDLHSHISLIFSTETDSTDDSTDTFLMEIINDEFIYISTRLDNQNVRISKTYKVLDKTIDRNKLYQLYNLMQDNNG